MKYALTSLLILIIGLWYFYPTQEALFGSDSGALSPGTMADDATVGTIAWFNVNNAKVSDGLYAQFSSDTTAPIDSAIKIVKPDGTIGTTNKSTGATWSTTESYVSFGNSSDLWGETWTPEDINDIDFGVVLSAVSNGGGGSTTHYLKATNFGFAIPTGATINGILIEIERRWFSGNEQGVVDHIRATIYYTEASATPQVQVRSGQINVRSGNVIIK